MTTTVLDLLSAGRLQEAEWLMRKGNPAPFDLNELKRRLGTCLDPNTFFVTPGYYAPLSSWLEAERCCGQAYQAESVVQRYRQKAQKEALQHSTNSPIGSYAMRQLAALQHTWIELGQPNPFKVLDFGGALGGHFHAISAHWPWVPLHWTVCETNAVAAAGQEEFELQMPEGHQLRFSAETKDVLDTGIDVILASCSLQYLEHWENMIELFRASEWLLLDRVPLIDHPSDLIDIQVVPASYTDTRYPGWKFSASSWLPRLKKAGFSMVSRWIVPEDHWSILDMNSGKIRWQAKHDHGFLLRRDQDFSKTLIV